MKIIIDAERGKLFMKKIDNFINRYSVSKTLRFKVIPVGKTQENIEAKCLLMEDEERAELYKKAKKIIDSYHKEFIEKVLDRVSIKGLDDYVVLYRKKEKNDNEKKKIKEFEADFRKQIASEFSKDELYKKLFDKSLIEEILPKWLKEEEDKKVIEHFKGFKTAFEGFNQNRVNMYSEGEESTAIAYRCINDNLPKFISNSNCFEGIRNALGNEVLEKIAKEHQLDPYRVEDLFCIDFFDHVLNNTGIEFYNGIIGGFFNENEEKIKGLNEYINLYNQQLPKEEKRNRIPLLKCLYKQILSDRESNSFYQEGYKNTAEMLSDIKSTTGMNSSVFQAIIEMKGLFQNISIYNPSGIYVKNGVPVTNLSNAIAGDWSVIRNNWEKDYDRVNMVKTPKDMEKYEEKRRKAFSSIESFSLDFLAGYLMTESKEYTIEDVLAYYSNTFTEMTDRVKKNAIVVEDIISKKEGADLTKEKISAIKEYFDAIKDIEQLIKPLLGSNKETDRDEVFYGRFIELFEKINVIDSLYNLVRNYVTKKPYSTDKYKLYFQNPQFLGGWDRNKVADYRATLLRKDGLYFLAVIDKADSKVLEKMKASEGDLYYEVLDYKLIPGASKQLPHVFFSGKGREQYNPSKEVIKAYENKTCLKGVQFNIDDCHKVIDYYKYAIENSDWNEVYHFHFSDTEKYEDLSGFFREVDSQGYKLTFYKVGSEEIDRLVDDGKIYLFQLYNKDFSQYKCSHGTDNLHTMFFKQIFNENNGGNIKLCGGAELFFRKASIKEKDRVIHPAGQLVTNKNPLNKKKESLFNYDLIKDKRYTQDQYELHIPITLNRTADGNTRINEDVRRLLREDTNPYVIGIDRGERNLLYVCVIDGKGDIVEQYSLNEIVNEYKGMTIKTDYHNLLSRKEEERDKARKDWMSIENIKELKEGYISQVVHKICSLVLKYDAIIAMEDLNSGFKNSRKKVEKQVYQKFEKALIDKLNYMADKTLEIGENGSVTQGYQIAEPFKSFKTMGTQNGFIFYIPAWLTSKIDPVTGFVDLLKPKYTSIADAKNFIQSLDYVKYNEREKAFEISVDYEKFPRTEADYKKKWVLYSKGTRIKTERNAQKNGQWDSKEVDLTEEFKNLFKQYGIDISNGDLRNAICEINEKEFFVGFIGLLKLALQMRNSMTGRTDIDYLISPVKSSDGTFFDSRLGDNHLPKDADANGAYNIARKALWAVKQFKESDTDNLAKVKIAISNKEWLEFVQNG